MAYVTRIDNGQEITIHYLNVGSGEPIVFHHGNGNSANNWKDLGYVDELAKHYQLIMLDSRGYGKSSKPHDPEAYSLKSRVDDTIAVLDELKIEQAHCLGGSIGASICLLLAKDYPNRFKSYILATPYFQQFGEEFKPSLRQGSLAFINKLEEFLGERLSNEVIRNTFIANDSLAILAANSSKWFDYKEYIKYLKDVPSLIYLGGKEPTLNEMEDLAKQLPKSTLHVIPGFTHVDAYWNGKIAASTIHNFIQTLR